MNNQDSGTFFSLLREVIRHSSMPSDRLDYFSDLLTEENYINVKPEEAVELSKYLAEASNNLDSEVLDSRDPEMIYNLTDLKDFANELMNEAEENALNLVLEGNDQTQTVQEQSSTKGGNWLLDKFAGLIK